MRTWQMEAHHCSHLFHSILPQPRPQPSPWRFLPPPHFSNPKPFSPSRIYFSSKYPRWDSNAETIRDRKFNFSFRGKGENDDDDEEEEEEEEADEYGTKRRWWSDEPPGIKEGTGGIWEEAIDSVWIFKVFKSYGWTLPIIILSWLVASGPKAFLMALALPLGQSALALAFEKLWGRGKSKPKRKSRVRRKPSAAASTVGGTKVEKEPGETQRSRKGKTSYQSWVDNGSVDQDNQGAPSFGGWDDFDGFGPATRSSRATNGSERMPAEKVKLSKRVRKSDKPLLVRLLIALFPFLGTWTKML